MQKYEKKTKETCQNGKKISQNGKMFVKTEKREFLGLFLPFFLPFLRCFPFFGYSFSSAFVIFSKRYFLGLIPLNFANWR